jgi:hypothetical protein
VTGSSSAIPGAAALLLAAASLLVPACEEEGPWQRVAGFDRSADLNGIWGASADDIWIVGELAGSALVHHYDGESWSEIPVPGVHEGLDEVWGAEGAVYVTGHGGVMRRAGDAWERWPEVEAVALWGFGPDDVFAAGTRRVWRFDGDAWQEETAASHLAETDDLELVGIWGSSPTSTWVVGGRVVCECGATTALYHSETAWTLADLGTEMFIGAVWGAGPTEVFAVGGAVFTDEGSGIFRFDGQQWTEVGNGESEHLSGVWGTSAADVFAVGLDGEIVHFDGGTWSRMRSGVGKNLRDVWGPAGGEVVYAVGAKGTVLRYQR